MGFNNLEGKWNDYIGVQKEVIAVLKKLDYFKQDNIINLETEMMIRLTTKGIKETLGKGKRFQNLPKVVKQQKVATLRVLPSLIKEGALIDNEMHSIRIAVKKKANSKHFYIHHIDTEKSSKLLSPS